jgi:flagellar biosynthesis/type III secretory pathway protein FliH
MRIGRANLINMLLTEWNIDDAKVIWREEGWEEGMEKGREEGRAEVQTILNLVRQGYTAEQIEKMLALGGSQPARG